MSTIDTDTPSPAGMPLANALIVATSTLVVGLAVARLPAGIATGGLDSSWCSVLRHAVGHGLDFGTDIVFTFGPLGFAATGGYSGGVALLTTWAGAVLTMLFVLPMVLVAGRLPWQQRCGFLLLVGALPLIRISGLDGLVQAGLYCWGILAFTTPASGDRRSKTATAIGLGLAVYVALIGLAKFSWLLTGGLTLAAVVADLALRGQRFSAATVASAAAGVFLVGWSALGQPLANLPVFLWWSLEIASGYSQAMGTRGPNAVLFLALLATGLCAGGIVVRCRAAALPGHSHLQGRRWLLGLWLSALLFIGWKHGMIRAAAGDTHVTVLLASCVALAFALPLIPLAAPAVDRVAPYRCWIMAVLALTLAQWMQIGSLEEGVALAIKRISTNARILLRPEPHHRWLDDVWSQARSRMALPTARSLIGDEPVDVFGHSQDYAIANGLEYRPRPMFQSYAVYTRRIAELNDRFYHSNRAPDWVLFELGSIDGRYPGLEDALALRTILHDYRSVGTDDRFLVLRRERREPVRLELLASGTSRAGDRIDVTAYRDRDLWLEIDAAPGLLARLESFVLRPPPVRLRIWADGFPAEGYAYTSPVPMLATGFIASPVLGGTDDAANLLTCKPTRRLNGFAVETSSRGRGTAIRYRLSAITGGLTGATSRQSPSVAPPADPR